MPIDFTLTREQRELQLAARRFARDVLAEVGPATRALRTPIERFAATRPMYEQRREQRQRDIDIDGVELFGDDGHVEEAGALAAERRRHDAAEKPGADQLLVHRPRRGEALDRRAQRSRCWADFCEHVAREATRRKL